MGPPGDEGACASFRRSRALVGVVCGRSGKGFVMVDTHPTERSSLVLGIISREELPTTLCKPYCQKRSFSGGSPSLPPSFHLIDLYVWQMASAGAPL
jgi:hypothetical protein